jgi:transcription termination/antitermination protein NusG
MLGEDRPKWPWYAVYVKSRHEKHVASILCGKGYESFVPTYRSKNKSGKIFELPLFAGYVFSRFDRVTTLPVMSTSSVFSIIGHGHGPQPIPEVEIDGIKEMLSRGMSPFPWPYLAPGQSVYIAEGPLQGLTGVVVTASSERWLVVSVHLLHRSVAVKLDRSSFSHKAVAPIQRCSDGFEPFVTS